MIRQTLRDLPVGLVQTYERILLKISTVPLPRQEIALRAFKWMVCSRRPMKAEELQEAVAFDGFDHSWDKDKIPDKDLMIETCRGLLVRDKEDGTVRFAHHTVQQYLLSAPAIGTRFQIPPRSEAEAFVGEICVTYLSFSDFETQVALRTPNVQLEHRGVLKVGGPVSIPTILGIGKSLLDIPYRLLGGKSKTAPLDIDYGKYLTPNRPKGPQAPSTLTEKYRLLEYVIEYWVDHTQVLKPALDAKLQRLVMYKTLSFEFRPWGPNQHFGPYGCGSCPNLTKAKELPFMSLFHYAAHAGHWSLIESLVTEYCQHEYPSDETFLIACRQGQDKIVRNLMRKIKFDISDGRAINIAVTAGQADVLKYLLDPEEKDNKRASSYNINSNASSLLNLAANNGHENVVDTIFNYCTLAKASYVNKVDTSTGRTALHSAVKNGHENVIWKLLASGAEIRTNGTTAIHIAAEYGHRDILLILLKAAFLTPDSNISTPIVDSVSDSETSHSASIRFHDLEGYIPLYKAALNGHSAVVESILEHQPTIIDTMNNGRVRSNGKRHTELTAVHLAAIGGHLSVLKILANSKAHVNAKGESDWTALHFAAAKGHEEVVEWLLQNGADPYVKAKDHMTPLQIACSRGYESIVQAFLTNLAGTYHFSLLTKVWWTDLIESAAMDRREAVLGTLLAFVGALGEMYLEKAIRVAKKKKYHRALALLELMLRERAWERETDVLVQGWRANFSGDTIFNFENLPDKGQGKEGWIDTSVNATSGF